MKNLSVFIMCLLSASLALSAAEEAKEGNPHGPIAATIVRSGVLSNELVSQTTAVTILNKDLLRKLEEFFPDYQKSPTSKNPPVGWEQGYTVYFEFSRGRTIAVDVSINDNGGIWTMGSGDLKTNGNFAKFVEDLENQKEARKKN